MTPHRIQLKRARGWRKPAAVASVSAPKVKPPGSAKLERAQGAFVTDAEIERLIDHCAAQAKPQFEKEIQASINGDGGDDDDDVSAADEELIIKCIEVVVQEQKASASLLQRRLRLGYPRAARMVNILEQRGIVGPGDGAKAHILDLKTASGQTWGELIPGGKSL